jgi:CheY-like chemotaxis protein
MGGIHRSGVPGATSRRYNYVPRSWSAGSFVQPKPSSIAGLCLADGGAIRHAACDSPGMAVVLVINDEKEMLDAYESMLESLGHRPVTKATVDTGPETVRAVGADALVVDLQRPDEDEFGLRIIEELRADDELRAFPIILCSGAAEAVHTLRPRLDALGVPIVIKPFSLEELERTLASALKLGGHDGAPS